MFTLKTLKNALRFQGEHLISSILRPSAEHFIFSVFRPYFKNYSNSKNLCKIPSTILSFKRNAMDVGFNISPLQGSLIS